MDIPIRCFTCGKVIANKWEHFKDLKDKGHNPATILNNLGFTRYCCRRMFLTHVEIELS